MRPPGEVKPAAGGYRHILSDLSQNLNQRILRSLNSVAEANFGIGSKNLPQNLSERVPRPWNSVGGASLVSALKDYRKLPRASPAPRSLSSAGP